MHRPGNASVRLERRVLVSPVARTDCGTGKSNLRRWALNSAPDVLGRLDAILNIGLNQLCKNSADRPSLIDRSWPMMISMRTLLST